MSEILVVQHDPLAGPSAFVEVLDASAGSVPWRLVEVPSDDPLPDPVEEVAGIVVMGGTMSAVAPQVHPWMPGELAWLQRAVRAEVPVLGVCLGAQLLGAALGGVVSRRARPEVGFLSLTRTAEGRRDVVVGDWVDGSPALLLHEDEVSTLPPDARPLLEGSDGTPAWRHGSALAVQLHPEVPAEQLAAWTRMGSLAGILAASGWEPARLVAEGRRHEGRTVPAGQTLLRRWIDVEVRPRREGRDR